MMESAIAMPGPAGRFADERDLALCRAMIRHGSRSFHAASLLLPGRFRRDAYALYAFCRLSDDAVDLGAGDMAAVDRLGARLDAIYAGRPMDGAVDRAFADMALERGLPRAWMDALLDGFRWDAEGRTFRTLGELRAYAARVAGSVGVMMAHLMGVRDEARLACAAHLGLAMQFTNIARDVGEDARMGRIYLPLAWLEEAGTDPERFLAAPAPSDAVRALTARLLGVAADHYALADEGLRALPVAYRPAMWAARRLYAAIGDEIAAADFDSVTRRAHTGAARKLALLADAFACAVPARACDAAKPAAETAFLLRAAPGPRRAHVDRAPARAPLALRLIEISEALARRERGENVVPETARA